MRPQSFIYRKRKKTKENKRTLAGNSRQASDWIEREDGREDRRTRERKAMRRGGETCEYERQTEEMHYSPIRLM